MSRISDTRFRTRDAAARLVAAGRLPHELTVDLIYTEIRQGSRTTINDELKLWKDEQVRNDALSTALPPAVANAMLSVWALAIGHGEQVFARRSEDIEAEFIAAQAHAESLTAANVALQAETGALRGQLEDHQTRLAAGPAGLAQARADHSLAQKQLESAKVELAALRTQSEQVLRDALQTHARELESLRVDTAERETTLRAEVDQAAARLESVQKHVMMQVDEARNAHRRAEAALTKTQQRKEELVGDVQRLTAEAAEQRRLADRLQQQLTDTLGETRTLRGERDVLAQQVALLQGQLKAQDAHVPARPARRSR